jgi:Zn-dependent membrane protease YugP
MAMRFQFFWDEPYGSFLSLLFQLSTTLTVLGIGLALTIIAHRRIGRVQEIDDGGGVNAEEFVSAILKAGQANGWSVVRATGPLANFHDPNQREVRLSAGVAGSRTPEALGIAAHQAGHALRQARGEWFSKARVACVIGSKLASGVAWLTLLAGILMLSPMLCERAAFLYTAAVLGLVALQPGEADANHRASMAIAEAGLDASWTEAEKVALGKALEAARWVEIASTLPGPRRWWIPRRLEG